MLNRHYTCGGSHGPGKLGIAAMAEQIKRGAGCRVFAADIAGSCPGSPPRASRRQSCRPAPRNWPELANPRRVSIGVLRPGRVPLRATISLRPDPAVHALGPKRGPGVIPGSPLRRPRAGLPLLDGKTYAVRSPDRRRSSELSDIGIERRHRRSDPPNLDHLRRP